MPFREIDQESTALGSAARTLERWIRRIFLDDWSLKLLALAITIGLWYGVTGQRELVAVRLPGIQLTFRLPENMLVSNDPRSEVEVTLTGTRRALNTINARDLVVYVDLSDRKAGERVVQLTPQRVRMELPEGVQIETIEPKTVPLRLEPRIERMVEVEVRLDGNPAPGYELRGVRVSPEQVRVRGPESNMNALGKAPTETISLEGRKANFIAPQVSIDVQDPKLDVQDTVVNVYLEIGEQRSEKIFADVRVEDSTGSARPAVAADVTLYGPQSLVRQLRTEDLHVVLEADQGGATLPPRLVLPPAMEGQIEVRSIELRRFSRAR